MKEKLKKLFSNKKFLIIASSVLIIIVVGVTVFSVLLGRDDGGQTQIPNNNDNNNNNNNNNNNGNNGNDNENEGDGEPIVVTYKSVAMKGVVRNLKHEVINDLKGVELMFGEKGIGRVQDGGILNEYIDKDAPDKNVVPETATLQEFVNSITLKDPGVSYKIVANGSDYYTDKYTYKGEEIDALYAPFDIVVIPNDNFNNLGTFHNISVSLSGIDGEKIAGAKIVTNEGELIRESVAGKFSIFGIVSGLGPDNGDYPAYTVEYEGYTLDQVCIVNSADPEDFTRLTAEDLVETHGFIFLSEYGGKDIIFCLKTNA